MKITVISPSKMHAEVIQRILQEEVSQEEWVVSLFEGDLDKLEPLVWQETPDLLIIDSLCQSTEDLKAIEQLTQHYRLLAIIILCQGVSQDFLLAALRLGVRDVLQLPLTPGALHAAVSRIDVRRVQPVQPQKNGKVIVFLACKGGSGATFLATNLGYILGEMGSSVALFDLNLQFGDAALFMSDAKPEYTLSDVAGKGISRLDASFLQSSMQKISQNYMILPAPEDAESALEVKAENVETMLGLARTQYDFVILDIGQTLNAISVKALDYADVIFPVLQVTLPFIRGAKRVLEALFSLGNSREKIRLVVNRYEKGGDILLDDIERALGMKVYKAVPNSYKAVSASVNQGVPIMRIAKNDQVTDALSEIASDLREKPNGEGKKTGWLSSLLQRS